MTHVPYKGIAQVVTAILSNEVQFAFANLFSTKGHWQAGRLRLIAHAGSKRLESMPEVPTIAESGVPGFDCAAWFGLVGPGGMPPELVQQINAAVHKVLARPDVQKKLMDQGLELTPDSPADFRKTLQAEMTKWAGVIKQAGVNSD